MSSPGPSQRGCWEMRAVWISGLAICLARLAAGMLRGQAASLPVGLAVWSGLDGMISCHSGGRQHGLEAKKCPIMCRFARIGVFREVTGYTFLSLPSIGCEPRGLLIAISHSIQYDFTAVTVTIWYMLYTKTAKNACDQYRYWTFIFQAHKDKIILQNGHQSTPVDRKQTTAIKLPNQAI